MTLSPDILCMMLHEPDCCLSLPLVSAARSELVLPLAAHLNVPKGNVLANRMNWQWDDETGEPTHLVGFDVNEPMSKNKGKPAAIARLREKYPYNTVWHHLDLSYLHGL